MCTQPLFWWAHGVLVATWLIDGHPAFILVASWHLGGHPVFTSWEIGGHPAIFFGGYVTFGDKLASCWAPSIYFAGHVLFSWVPVEDESLKDWGHVSNPAFSL